MTPSGGGRGQRSGSTEGLALSVEPILVLIALAILANVGLMAAVVLPPLVGRRGPLDVGGDRRPEERPLAEVGAVIAGPPEPAEVETPSRTYDRIVRIVSWVVILAASAIVAITGLWRDAQPAIFVVLAVAGLAVLVLHDVLPADALGTSRYLVEGSVGITFAALLVALTGGERSPFFFAFPLIVAGAALVVRPAVTLALTVAAGLAYLAAIAVATVGRQIEPISVATIGTNLAALALLAYIATVVAAEQRRARDAAIRLSTIDQLTGLFNRNLFFAAIDREIARSSRSGRGFCLLMMDLDELKAVNDRFGHYHGDRVLRAVSEVIRNRLRRIDTPARYGGDEFVVLLPETDPSGAFVLAEKIRLGVAELSLEIGAQVISPSLSVGVVAYPDDGRTADELMISADQAMYAAKREGKDRVMGPPLGGPANATAGRAGGPL
ncbi:MAG TPA: diguanylate cyclase [Candidatus Limnocylindrales bacterium]|nr:diguanylate cyclase [Candidatus Limnocylindrales bacterium]